jgi:hypothetical protein
MLQNYGHDLIQKTMCHILRLPKLRAWASEHYLRKISCLYRLHINAQMLPVVVRQEGISERQFLRPVNGQ